MAPATAEQLTSQCDIKIIGVDLAISDGKMLAACLAKATYHLHGAKSIDIYCSERKSNGWLEYSMMIYYKGEREHMLQLGCIQRTIGADIEFHS